MKLRELYSNTSDDVFKQSIINPMSVVIDPNTYVEVIKNDDYIYEGYWGEVVDWLEDNWDSLSGSYDIVRDGETVHSFTVANK